MLLSTSRLWLLYALLLGILSSLFFADLAHLGLDTHDVETFRDHERINSDFAFFFSADKEQLTGRPFAELFKYTASLLIGNTAGSFHLLVVMLHGLCALFLARYAYALSTPLPVALTGGLLFLVNVAHFQAVHLIAALDYPLALLLVLLALLAYARHQQKTSTVLLIAHYILCAAAALSHLSAVAIWPFILYLHWQHNDTPRVAIWGHLLSLGLLLALALAVNLLLASHQTSTWDSLERYPQVSLFALLSDWSQVGLWLSSRLLSTAHWLPIPVYTQQTWELILGAVCISTLIYLTKQHQLWAAWTLLFLLPFVPLTQHTLLDMPVGPSRYLYPASAGFALLLAQGLHRLGPKRHIALLLLLAVSSLYGLQKAEALSRYTSGRSYIANGDLPQGINQLRLAIDQAPNHIDRRDAYTRLITIALDSTAIAPLIVEQSIKNYPNQQRFSIAHQILQTLISPPTRSTVDQQLNELAAQNDHHRRWIARLYENAGRGFAQRGESPEALYAYQRALHFAPEHAVLYVEYGWLLFAHNYFEDAIQQYQQALALHTSARAQFEMALAYLALGDVPSAQKAYAKGLQKYGREEAERVGAHKNLERFVELGIQIQAAQHVLEKHFPN